jgi:hypothetical protein
MKATLFAALVAVSAASGALAQEKYKYSFKTPNGVTKYTQQHTLDVGDVPGHQIRVAELHTVFTGDAPSYAGVKVKESWARLSSDYVDGSGRAMQYAVAHMENGDKVFSRTELIAQSSVGADGARKLAFTTVTTLTGGTANSRASGALSGERHVGHEDRNQRYADRRRILVRQIIT